MTLLDNLKASPSNIYDVVIKLDNDWQELRTLVQQISYHVFYNVLKMDYGYPCGDFRFEMKPNGIAVVVQQYQNGSSLEPYPNAEFSYPLSWIVKNNDPGYVLNKNEVEVNDEI